MAPETVTAYAALVITIITSLIVPYVIKKRKDRKEDAVTELASWQGLTKALQGERDDLRKRLDGVETEYKRRMDVMEAEYQSRLDAALERIKQLEGEVADLYRRLYQRGPQP